MFYNGVSSSAGWGLGLRSLEIDHARIEGWLACNISYDILVQGKLQSAKVGSGALLALLTTSRTKKLVSNLIAFTAHP